MKNLFLLFNSLKTVKNLVKNNSMQSVSIWMMSTFIANVNLKVVAQNAKKSFKIFCKNKRKRADNHQLICLIRTYTNLGMSACGTAITVWIEDTKIIGKSNRMK